MHPKLIPAAGLPVEYLRKTCFPKFLLFMQNIPGSFDCSLDQALSIVFQVQADQCVEQ